MFTICRYICLFMLAACVSGSAVAAELTVNKIVAVVNGEMVTLHELRAHTAADLARKQISLGDPRAEEIMRARLDSLINDILIRQEAGRYKITVSDAEVESEVTRFMKNGNFTKKTFDAELKKQGTTLPLFRERMRDAVIRQRMINQMIARKILISQEEIEQYYNTNKNQFQGVDAADISLIIMESPKKAQDVYSKIRSGAITFEKAASTYSIDVTAKNGGKLGKVQWSKLPPGLQKILSSLRPGEISNLVSLEKHQAIIRLNSISGDNNVKPLTEVSSQIESVLRDARVQERFSEFAEQLRKKAVIDIRL